MFDKVVLAGAPWCSSCKGMRDVLTSLGIDYQYIDIDTEEGAVFAQQNRIRSLPKGEDDHLLNKVFSLRNCPRWASKQHIIEAAPQIPLKV